jgi:hypothetical protein
VDSDTEPLMIYKSKATKKEINKSWFLVFRP